MISRKPIRFKCTTGKPGRYPKGMDPQSMAVQIAHDVWRWYMPEVTVGPAVEPLLREWAAFVRRCYQAAGEHGRKSFVIESKIGPDNLPLIRIVG